MPVLKLLVTILATIHSLMIVAVWYWSRQISIDSQASTSVAGSSDVKLSSSNGIHGVIANGGPAPDSPFEKVGPLLLMTHVPLSVITDESPPSGSGPVSTESFWVSVTLLPT